MSPSPVVSRPRSHDVGRLSLASLVVTLALAAPPAVRAQVMSPPDPPRDVAFVPPATNDPLEGLALVWAPPTTGKTPSAYRVLVTDDLGNTLADLDTADTSLLFDDLGQDVTLTATIQSLDGSLASSVVAVSGHLDTVPPIASLELVPADRPTGIPVYDSTRITLVGEDDRSGIAELWYAVDGGTPQRFNGHFRLAASAAPQEVAYWAIDAAGNVGPTDTWSVVVDAAPVAERVCASPPFASGALGKTIAVDGDTAFVGERDEIVEYLFDGSSWSETGVRLPLPDSGARLQDPLYGGFALSGDVLIVSDPRDGDEPDQRDRLLVYERSGANWFVAQTVPLDTSALTRVGDLRATPETSLIAFDGTRIALVVPAVAFSGQTLGAVFTFVHDGAGFVQEAAWQPAELAALSSWSYSDAGFNLQPMLDGDWLYLAGGHGTGLPLIKTWVYHHDGAAWAPKSTNLPFADEVDAAAGGTVVVDFTIYRRLGDGSSASVDYEIAAYFAPLDIGLELSFPHPITLGDQRMLFGSWGMFDGRGSVYEFEDRGGAWDLHCVHQFDAQPDAGTFGSTNWNFGSSTGFALGFGGDHALAGAPYEDVSGARDAGCLYRMVDRPRLDYLCINALPTANAGPDVSVNVDETCGAVVTLDGARSSDRDGDTFTYQWSIVGGPGMGPSDAPILIADDGAHPVVRLPEPGVWEIELSVLADGGVADSDIVAVTVVSDAPPVLLGVPADAIVACNAIPEPANVTIGDSCSAVLTYETYVSDEIVYGFDYHIHRIWTASDGVHQVSAEQILTVETEGVIDDLAPFAMCRNTPLPVEIGNAGFAYPGAGRVSGELVDDDSYDACGISSYAVAPELVYCADRAPGFGYTYRDVELTVSDFSGNTASCTAQLAVYEHVAPVARCEAAGVALGGDGTITLAPDHIDDGSSDTCDPLAARAVDLPSVPPPSPTLIAASTSAFGQTAGERDRADRRQRGYAVYRDVLYFAGRTTNDGQELWRYPGATGGQATRVVDLRPSSSVSSRVFHLTVYQDELYFTANTASAGSELWVHDGATTSKVARA